MAHQRQTPLRDTANAIIRKLPLSLNAMEDSQMAPLTTNRLGIPERVAGSGGLNSSSITTDDFVKLIKSSSKPLGRNLPPNNNNSRNPHQMSLRTGGEGL